MTTWIKGADWIVAWDQSDQRHVYLRDGDVVFEGDAIAFVGRGYAGDADEVVEPDLWDELEHLGFPDCRADGFQMRRRMVYEGKKLRRVFQPDWKTVLVRTDYAYFEDRSVHEALGVNGSLERLRTEILHSSFRSADDQYARIRTYARLAAQDLASQGKRASVANLWLRPAWRWFTELILQGGIVDGPVGVTMASRSAYGVHLRYRYLREMNGRS